MPAEEAKLMVFQTGCKPTLPSSSYSCIQACKPQVQYKTMLLADTNNSSFNQQETSETHLENVRKLFWPIFAKRLQKNNQLFTPPVSPHGAMLIFFLLGVLSRLGESSVPYASNPLSCQSSSALSLRVIDISCLFCLISVLLVIVHPACVIV